VSGASVFSPNNVSILFGFESGFVVMLFLTCSGVPV
jgi:hypothetical protein